MIAVGLGLGKEAVRMASSLARGYGREIAGERETKRETEVDIEGN